MGTKQVGRHTPGPWEWIRDGRAEYLMPAGKTDWWEFRIADDGSASGEYSTTITGNSPNGRLIAAAPELLAMLQELRECAEYWSEYDVPVGIVERLDSVIAKALGVQPSTALSRPPTAPQKRDKPSGSA